ncbi:ketopantoate reductase family protein [Phytohabitans rumicis]|uniref:2-dehydropantoate 2-reductase n=1 Tax=Phytohabitans rumicis TaxID=1076125 RepID=A0A6V8KWB5_9ACTN|nr:2-dehydropantoate 2-reductase [Phytohabitans rumicis]GFJ86599.1 2-dehydropantoate 2-reductase [Phytohabitans rumicis]
MRFVVYGAGAVGGTLAGLLADAGYEVRLVARGAHLAVIRRDGLRVLSPAGSRTYRLPATDAPGDLDWRPGDVVLLGVKGAQTSAAVRALAACADSGTPVVCVQNGVANERTALRRFADVYGVCVMFPATHVTPGVVVAHCAPVPGILDIGRYPHGVDGTAEAIAEAFRAATFHSVLRPDVMRWKYRKLLTNLSNAVEAVCGRLPAGAEVVARLRAEGEAVLRAAGIAFASESEDAERRGDILRRQPVEGQSRDGSSSWQSLARGTGSVETDYLNGEIVLLGRLHGVPTPVNAHAQRVANAHARAGARPGTRSLAEFMAGV